MTTAESANGTPAAARTVRQHVLVNGANGLVEVVVVVPASGLLGPLAADSFVVGDGDGQRQLLSAETVRNIQHLVEVERLLHK